MRQHPLLRWIELAEARRTEQLLNELSLTARPPYQPTPMARVRTPRLPLPWWRRLRPFRAANDLC
jgi:hypothetical protein